MFKINKKIFVNYVRWPIFVFLLLNAFLLTEILTYSLNRPILNSRWESIKRNLVLGVMGSDGALIDRSVFAGNRLNLNRWYGHQEFQTRETFDYDSLSFSLFLAEDAYLDFFYASEGDSRNGIRFSVDKKIPSYSFSNMKYYEYGDKQKLDIHPEANRWYQVQLKKENGQLKLVFEKSSFPLTKQNIMRTSIGFRGGALNSSVDNIKILSNGKKVFTESFRFHHNYSKPLLVHLLILMVFSVLIIVVFHRYRIDLFLIHLLLTTVLLSHYLFDYYSGSQKDSFVTQRHLIDDQPVGVSLYEVYQFKIVMKWAAFMGLKPDFKKLLEKDYLKDPLYRGPVLCHNNSPCKPLRDKVVKREMAKHPACQRIVFLGGSQTIGAGASTVAKTFVAEFHQQYFSKKNINCLMTINLGVSDYDIEEIKDYFIKEYQKERFDLLILNTRANDTDQSIIKPLEEFSSLMAKKKLPIVYLVEALSEEYEYWPGSREKTIRETAKRYDAPVLPLHYFIEEKRLEAKGKIWWDIVHYTDYGHKLVADWLVKNIN